MIADWNQTAPSFMSSYDQDFINNWWKPSILLLKTESTFITIQSNIPKWLQKEMGRLFFFFLLVNSWHIKLSRSQCYTCLFHKTIATVTLLLLTVLQCESCYGQAFSHIVLPYAFMFVAWSGQFFSVKENKSNNDAKCSSS